MSTATQQSDTSRVETVDTASGPHFQIDQPRGFVTAAARQFLAPTLTPPPAAQEVQFGQAWLLAGIAALACCCLCGVLVLALLSKQAKSARRCTREVCPDVFEEEMPDGVEDDDDDDEVADDAELERASWQKLSKSRPHTSSFPRSDCEDMPLLPEGTALPKFWKWLSTK
jgi:hypothetical protein